MMSVQVLGGRFRLLVDVVKGDAKLKELFSSDMLVQGVWLVCCGMMSLSLLIGMVDVSGWWWWRNSGVVVVVDVAGWRMMSDCQRLIGRSVRSSVPTSSPRPGRP